MQAGLEAPESAFVEVTTDEINKLGRQKCVNDDSVFLPSWHGLT